MDGVPYIYRVAVLVIVAVAIASVDRMRHGAKATRAREYSVLMLAGVAGAAYGMLNDLVTSTVSPEYFSLGKGLDSGPGLTVRSMALGAKAGCSAAVIVCSVWLFWSARASGDHPARMRKVVAAFWIPFGCAAGLAMLLPLVVGGWDPLDFGGTLQGLIPDSRASAFRHVWWAHLGAYGGLLLGAGLGMARMVKRPRIVRRSEPRPRDGENDGKAERGKRNMSLPNTPSQIASQARQS